MHSAQLAARCSLCSGRNKEKTFGYSSISLEHSNNSMNGLVATTPALPIYKYTSFDSHMVFVVLTAAIPMSSV